MKAFRRLFCVGVTVCCLCPMLYAQSNQLIKELENRRGTLQQQIAETESLLTNTSRDVSSLLDNLASLTGQIEEQRSYIASLNADADTIASEINRLNQQLSLLQYDLNDKREKYAAALRFMQRHRSAEEKLLFIFSAKTLAQSYRRLRHMREYAAYQQRQGEEIMRHQKAARLKQAELQMVKAAQDSLLALCRTEQEKLENQEKEQRALIAGLQRRQRALRNEIAHKQREANQLNVQIDRLINEEIEKKITSNPSAGKEKKASSAPYRMSSDEIRLSGSFENNRRRLPAPITGPYLIVSHYGQYAVKGLRHVKLDNKGINLQGRPGAQARAIFHGQVTAVFQLNGLFNVLIRHGAYISVYCNLASTRVKIGDEVQTGQELGPIFYDDAEDNRTVLHFQLRKEKQKLNPENWLDL